MSIASRLKEERERLQLSQKELAKAGGIARSTQALYETGLRDPTAEYLLEVRKTGIDSVYVLFGFRTPEPESRPTPVNKPLLQEIVLGIERWSLTRREFLPADTKAELIVLLYEHFRHQGHAPPKLLEQRLNLVAAMG